MTSLEKSIFIAKVLDDKKAEDIQILRVEEKSSVWEYFVLANGTSTTHLKALCGEIEEKLEKDEEKERPLHIEGYVSAEWILMDYNDVNVSIFQKESRMFYSLERLWQDADTVEWR